MINLLHMDCLDYMRECEDNAFDLAIVDPPYGIDVAKTGKVGGKKCAPVNEYTPSEWDAAPPPKEYFIQLERVSVNQIIWGANHFMGLLAKSSPCWVVWDKDNSGNFADCELAYTSFKTAVRKYSFRWNGMLQGNMKNKQIRIHATQKPIQLYDWLLTNYAKPTDRILDTHLGSGSSAIAAHYFGCDFVGIEIDKDYFDAAKARFAAETAQLDIFG